MMQNGNGYRLSSSSENKMASRREFCCAQLFGVLLFASGIVGGLLIGIYVYHGGPDAEVTCKNLPNVKTSGPMSQHKPTSPKPQTTSSTSPDDSCQTCKRRQARTEWDGADPEIFAPLTAGEMRNVYNFLLSNRYVDNHRIDSTAFGLELNFAAKMYLHLPEKEAVRKYKAGNGPYPGRYAEVHVVRGNRTDPDYMIYTIGPLQAHTMSIQQQYQDGELSYNSRPYDNLELMFYHELITPDFQRLKPLTTESFDGAFYPESEGGISIWYFNGPPGDTGDDRDTRFIAYLRPLEDIIELDFLPLSGTLHCPGTNVSSWYTYDYYYLNQGPYPDANSLLEAYNNGSLRKFTLPDKHWETVLDRLLPDRDTDAPFRRNSNMPPPRTYEPEGPRYSINGHNVDWMGWNFDVTSSQLRGPGLFEVTFQGQSIAYEISTNELSVVYGSGSSAQTNVIYADSMYGAGEVYGSMASIDCPKHATMLETTHWDAIALSPSVHRSTLTDFENAPLFRESNICVMECPRFGFHRKHLTCSFTPESMDKFNDPICPHDCPNLCW